MKNSSHLLRSLFLLICLSGRVEACLHFDANYRGKLIENKQQIFAFHDGSNAHYVVRTVLQTSRFPREIAWVLPFSALPSKYQEVNGPFFEELFPLTARTGSGYGGSEGLGARKGGTESGIKVHQKVEVGSYLIQPIEITKDGSGQELNQWLRKNKFNPMPMKLQEYYLKKGAAFLAIRMKMSHPSEGSLVSKPLHIVVPAKALSIPIKFTHEERVFDLELYVFSEKELTKDLSTYYLTKKENMAYSAKKGLKPFVDDILSNKSGFITKYLGQGLNGSGGKLALLANDPSFEVSDLQVDQ